MPLRWRATSLTWLMRSRRWRRIFQYVWKSPGRIAPSSPLGARPTVTRTRSAGGASCKLPAPSVSARQQRMPTVRLPASQWTMADLEAKAGRPYPPHPLPSFLPSRPFPFPSPRLHLIYLFPTLSFPVLPPLLFHFPSLVQLGEWENAISSPTRSGADPGHQRILYHSDSWKYVWWQEI